MPGTQYSGPISTGNGTNGVKVWMDEAIFILTPTDVPLQQRFATMPVDNVKVQWLNDELTPQELTTTSSTAAGVTTVVVSSTTLARVGDVYAVKDAPNLLIKVTAVVNATDLTVTRPFAGSTDATIANGATLILVGQDRDEGQDPLAGRFIDTTTDYNQTQVDQEGVEVTRTKEKLPLYGIPGSKMDRERQRKFKELAIRFERRLILNRRVDASGTKRQMGGVIFYATSNGVSDVKANLKSATNTALRNCFDQGATPSWLVIPPAMAPLYSALIDSEVRRTPGTGQTVGNTVTTFESDFGSVNITIDRHLPKTKALVLTPDFVKIGNYDEYFYEPLAKTGDSEKGHIVAEKTLLFREPRAHAVLTVTDA